MKERSLTHIIILSIQIVFRMKDDRKIHLKKRC